MLGLDSRARRPEIHAVDYYNGHAIASGETPVQQFITPETQMSMLGGSTAAMTRTLQKGATHPDLVL